MALQKILAGNWKMFKTRAEAALFFEALEDLPAAKPAGVRRIVAPSPTLLETTLAAALESGVEVFAQNCAWADSGAFTGEVSPPQLVDLGVKGTIIAHSERRQYFNETDLTAVKRTLAAFKHDLHVIYCIGEKLEERQQNKTEEVLTRQLAPVIEEILPGLSSNESAPATFIIAYEPVWAIGTGLNANPEQIAHAHSFIAKSLEKAKKNAIPILYGGSVKPDNVASFAKLDHVSGALVGGASLDPASYSALCQGFIP